MRRRGQRSRALGGLAVSGFQMTQPELMLGGPGAKTPATESGPELITEPRTCVRAPGDVISIRKVPEVKSTSECITHGVTSCYSNTPPAPAGGPGSDLLTDYDDMTVEPTHTPDFRIRKEYAATSGGIYTFI